MGKSNYRRAGRSFAASLQANFTKFNLPEWAVNKTHAISRAEAFHERIRLVSDVSSRKEALSRRDLSMSKQQTQAGGMKNWPIEIIPPAKQSMIGKFNANSSDGRSPEKNPRRGWHDMHENK
jgi:hypothetical protein